MHIPSLQFSFVMVSCQNRGLSIGNLCTSLLVIIGLLTCVVESISQHATLAEARCKATCLRECTATLMKRQDPKAQQLIDQLKTYPTKIQTECIMIPSFHYIECQNACEFKGTFADCSAKCMMKGTLSYRMCHSGCRNLADATENAMGDCPRTAEERRDAVRALGGYESSCHMDTDCPRPHQKCCDQICLNPVFSADIPPIVNPPRIMEHKTGRKFEMMWSYQRFNLTFPVLFILQVRTYFNPEFEIRYANPWSTLIMSTKHIADLKDLKVGEWYQFRVAAVSSLGSRGFDMASPPVRLSVLPQAPSPPRHLTDKVWSIHANGKINIEVHWMEPEYSNIPVTDYKIMWVQDHGYVQPNGQSLEAFTRFKKKVPGSKTYYEIEGLLADQTYKIEVTAVSQWGMKILESSPNTVFLTTPRSAKDQDSSSDSTPTNESLTNEGKCICDGSSHVFSGISVSEPIFENGRLQATVQLPKMTKGPTNANVKVEWVPRVCIDSAQTPTIPYMPNEESSPNDFSAISNINNNQPPTMSPSSSQSAVISGQSPSRSFLLPGSLRFNCRYSLRVTALSPDDNRLLRHTTVGGCFCTPSCRQVRLKEMDEWRDKAGKSRDMPKCKLYDPITPGQPRQITFKRLQGDSNDFSYNVSWASIWSSPVDPETRWGNFDGRTGRQAWSDSLSEVRFRVLWGRSTDEPVEEKFYSEGSTFGLTPRLDAAMAEMKVLKENVSWIVLRNLDRDKLYIVKIEAVAYHSDREVVSPEAVLYLFTDGHGKKTNRFGAYQSGPNSSQSAHRSSLISVLIGYLCYSIISSFLSHSHSASIHRTFL